MIARFLLIPLFWLAIGGVAYAYAGYPLLLIALARFRPRPVRKSQIAPPVSVIITVHNEAAAIAQKLRNTLSLDYPAGKIEVLVASDASSDGTDAIVAAYAPRGVRLVRSPSRLGKTAAQNLAVSQATGELLVLSDVSAQLATDALRAIVRPFADPAVGLVSGQDVSVMPTEHAAAVGESLYVRYEMWVRRLETVTASIVGASGSLYAVRRDLRAQLGDALIEDFAIPLLVIQAGRRVVSEPAARCVVPTTVSVSSEFRRRVRIQVGGVVALWENRRLLDPFRFPQTAWTLFGHKIARWLMPMWWGVALVTALLLARIHPVYATLAALQVLFYVLALVGWFYSRSPRLPACIGLPFSLTLATAAIGVGLVQALLGRRTAAWQPSERMQVKETTE